MNQTTTQTQIETTRQTETNANAKTNTLGLQIEIVPGAGWRLKSDRSPSECGGFGFCERMTDEQIRAAVREYLVANDDMAWVHELRSEVERLGSNVPVIPSEKDRNPLGLRIYVSQHAWRISSHKKPFEAGDRMLNAVHSSDEDIRGLVRVALRDAPNKILLEAVSNLGESIQVDRTVRARHAATAAQAKTLIENTAELAPVTADLTGPVVIVPIPARPRTTESRKTKTTVTTTLPDWAKAPGRVPTEAEIEAATGRLGNNDELPTTGGGDAAQIAALLRRWFPTYCLTLSAIGRSETGHLRFLITCVMGVGETRRDYVSAWTYKDLTEGDLGIALGYLDLAHELRDRDRAPLGLWTEVLS